MRLARVIQCRWVELYELHIFDNAFGTMYHSNTITRCNVRLGGCGIYCTRTASSHQCDATQIRINLTRLRVNDICSVALFVRRTMCNAHTQMVLRNDLYGKVMFQHINIRIMPHRFH